MQDRRSFSLVSYKQFELCNCDRLCNVLLETIRRCFSVLYVRHGSLVEIGPHRKQHPYNYAYLLTFIPYPDSKSLIRPVP